VVVHSTTLYDIVVCQLMVMERFGFEPDLSLEAVQERLKELEDTIRRRILREAKIKEGAENLKRATKDKNSLARVRMIVNEAENTLHNLNEELKDVRTYLQMTQDNNSAGPTTPKRPGNVHLFHHYTGVSMNFTVSWKSTGNLQSLLEIV